MSAVESLFMQFRTNLYKVVVTTIHDVLNNYVRSISMIVYDKCLHYKMQKKTCE